MKNHYKLFLTLILFCASIVACKLDPPIFPGDKGDMSSKGNTGSTGATGVTDTTGATGTTGTTGTTGGTSVTMPVGSNPQLTGKWPTRNAIHQTFDLLYNVIKSEPEPDILYDYVKLDDANGTAEFVNSELSIDLNYTYVITKENNKTYIRFSEDPFFRTGNFRIEVILEANTMTWVVIDPKYYDGPEMKGYMGTRLLFY
jgi:hypothetical protein